MSGFIGLEITGLEENIKALGTLRQEIPTELPDDVTQATFPIYYALADYPEERPGQKYVRTFAYRDSVYTKVHASGDSVEVEYGATDPAAIWLRGDGDSYMGAWMHVGRWRSLKEIQEQLVPVVVFKLQSLIDGLIKRVMG